MKTQFKNGSCLNIANVLQALTTRPQILGNHAFNGNATIAAIVGGWGRPDATARVRISDSYYELLPTHPDSPRRVSEAVWSRGEVGKTVNHLRFDNEISLKLKSQPS